MAAPAHELQWLYGLAAVPVLTDFIESGGFPRAPREWLTEVVAGAVIALLVARARRQHLEVLRLSRVDGLTGLGNRQAFEEAVERACARSQRSARPLCVLYIDVDDFKSVNDQLGHAGGDVLLRRLAGAIAAVGRAGLDEGFRVGGDEFVLLLQDCDAHQCAPVVARLRRAFEHHGEEGAMTTTLSIGVGQLHAEDTAESLLRRADASMYRQKSARHG